MEGKGKNPDMTKNIMFNKLNNFTSTQFTMESSLDAETIYFQVLCEHLNETLIRNNFLPKDATMLICPNDVKFERIEDTDFYVLTSSYNYSHMNHTCVMALRKNLSVLMCIALFTHLPIFKYDYIMKRYNLVTFAGRDICVDYLNNLNGMYWFEALFIRRQQLFTEFRESMSQTKRDVVDQFFKKKDQIVYSSEPILGSTRLVIRQVDGLIVLQKKVVHNRTTNIHNASLIKSDCKEFVDKIKAEQFKTLSYMFYCPSNENKHEKPMLLNGYGVELSETNLTEFYRKEPSSRYNSVLSRIVLKKQRFLGRNSHEAYELSISFVSPLGMEIRQKVSAQLDYTQPLYEQKTRLSKLIINEEIEKIKLSSEEPKSNKVYLAKLEEYLKRDRYDAKAVHTALKDINSTNLYSKDEEIYDLLNMYPHDLTF